MNSSNGAYCTLERCEFSIEKLRDSGIEYFFHIVLMTIMISQSKQVCLCRIALIPKS